MVLPLTPEGFTNIHVNSAHSNIQDNGSEKLLKPMSGFSTYSSEWREFAEIISKVNITQLPYLIICSNYRFNKCFILEGNGHNHCRKFV